MRKCAKLIGYFVEYNRRESVGIWKAFVAIVMLVNSLGASSAVPGPERILRTSFEDAGEIRTSIVGEGAAQTHINTPRYRQSAILSWGDRQYVGYYSASGEVVIARRSHDAAAWERTALGLFGDVSDAHNVIAVGIDSCGYVHVAWNMHNDPLNYVRSVSPAGVVFSNPRPMTGLLESQVTYPQFLRLPGGEFLFAYRDGGSGNGDLILNAYDCTSDTWVQLHGPLVAGEGLRNAYWQLAVGPDGSLHMSWTWRERLPVNDGIYSNRDLAYARSNDGGVSWETSEGLPQELPITADNAEYALRIPLGTGIMNQTSMAVLSDGTPVIAGLWLDDQPEPVPQYHLVYRDDDGWVQKQISRRSTADIYQVARPLVLSEADNTLVFLFRDLERGETIWMEKYGWPALQLGDSTALGLNAMGAWEPHVDASRFKASGMLSLFYQMQEALPLDPAFPRTGGFAAVAVLDVTL